MGNGNISEDKVKEQWKKFEDKDIYYKLTKSLLELYKFCEKLDDDPDAELKDNKEKYDVIVDLENEGYKGKLDKGFYAVQSYIRQYNIYKNKKFKMDRNGQEGYYRNYKGEFWIVKDELKVVGEVLNNSTHILKKYGKDIVDNAGKENFSELSKMFFHLVTTVGNVMPCVKGFNYTSGSGLDIAQDKVAGYIWITYGENEAKEINAFIKNHYLQDFIEEKDGKVKAIQFIDTTSENGIYSDNYKKLLKEEKEKIWNLFFYRTARVIMKRSYRILKEIDGDFSPEQKKEFNDAFIKFSGEFGINI